MLLAPVIGRRPGAERVAAMMRPPVRRGSQDVSRRGFVVIFDDFLGDFFVGDFDGVVVWIVFH